MITMKIGLNNFIKCVLRLLTLCLVVCVPSDGVLANEIPLRGVVEGFYGKPWTHEERIDMLKFCAAHGLNAYIYAPKDDPYHRSKWREDYPTPKMDELQELINVAKDNNVRFIFAVSPGLDINYDGLAGERDLRLMIRKLSAMYQVGVRDFAVFFDDIEQKDGRKQAKLLTRLTSDFVRTHDDVSRIITVPTEYFFNDMIDDEKNTVKTYTEEFVANVPKEILVLYTGNGVVPDGLSDDDFQKAKKIYGERLGLWWNYPVNDYMEGKLALGAIEKLPSHSTMPALFFNPMRFEKLSKIALATGADYAKDPQKYDAESSRARAVTEQYGKSAKAMLTFAEHSQHLENSWAKIGAQDGASMRIAFDNVIKEPNENNLNVARREVSALNQAIVELKRDLPKDVLTECMPQLKLAEDIARADLTALDLLEAMYNDDAKITRYKADLQKALTRIKAQEPKALFSDKTARAFIDEVLAKCAQ